MHVKAKKTLRFDALLETAGQPVQVTLWTKPEDDHSFMRAVKEKRVVTVIQNNIGPKKDYGLVGFYPQDRATYLLFSKPIEEPGETKVVGIKYERLATAEPKGGIYKPPTLPDRPKQKASPLTAKAKPQPHPEPQRPKPKAIPIPKAAPTPKVPPAAKPSTAQAPEPKPPEPPPPPRLFKFESTVELKATQTATLEVEAASAKEAASLLKERAEKLSIDPAQATVSRKVRKPQKKPQKHY